MRVKKGLVYLVIVQFKRKSKAIHVAHKRAPQIEISDC